MPTKPIKVLYVSHKPIYPIVDGGCKAMAQFLGLLQKNDYDITHFTLATEKHPFNREAYPSDLDVVAQFISTKTNVLAFSRDLFSRKSYHLSRFKSDQVSAALVEITANKRFDFIILESLYSLTYAALLKEKTGAPIVYRAHNIEHKIWEKLASNSKNPLKSTLLSKMAKSLKKEETNLVQKANGILAITDDDKHYFENKHSKVASITIPINMEVQQARTNFKSPIFFHLGSMNWYPNVEAVESLVNSVFPKILLLNSKAKLVLVGSHMNKQLYTKFENVEAMGFVEDLPRLYENVGILISPMKSGSGVRVKILEALSYGIPVITTTQGAEGIPTNSGLYPIDNEDEMVQKATELSESELLRAEAGIQAQQFIQQNYSTESVSLRLDAFLRSI